MSCAEGHHPITVGSTCLSRSDLMAAAGAVSAALGGISRVAVLATPTMETVLAVVGALRAGVAVVPVPSAAGSAEPAQILAEAQPQAWLGAAPADTQGRPGRPGRSEDRG